MQEVAKLQEALVHQQQSSAGGATVVQKSKKVRVWEEVDSEEEVPLCTNCKKWGIECEWLAGCKGKACWECMWQHISCSLSELIGRPKKWALVRDGVLGAEELLAEIKGGQGGPEWVTTAISTWHRDRKSPMVQALRSLVWEIQDVWFWREDSTDSEESGTEGGGPELAVEVSELVPLEKPRNEKIDFAVFLFIFIFIFWLYAC
jgi:hypothetical protein